jgi:uncharacterized membrane protein
MTETLTAPGPEPSTRDDRLLAGLAHLAFLGGFWLVAPVAIYAWKRKESPFVAFHALQAAFLALAAIPLTIVTWVMLAALTIGGAMLSGERGAGVLAFGWLFALVLPGLCVALVALVAGLRALRGERWSIPILGRIAQRVLEAPER